MALAKNLNKNKLNIKVKKPKKYVVWIILVAAIILGAYGVVNLAQIAPSEENKQEHQYETGDRPLPQTIKIWVVADGGLYLREKADSKSSILKLIPDGTELEALETQDDWYRVSYMNSEGWVHAEYTTRQAPKESPTKGWNSYKNEAYDYTLQYPQDWVVVDYGENEATASKSYVGLGLQLPSTLDPSKLPPIVVRVTEQTKDQAISFYNKKTDVSKEDAKVAGIEGSKFTYTSSSGTQLTVYVVTKGSQTYILEESGGYVSELALVVGSLNLP